MINDWTAWFNAFFKPVFSLAGALLTYPVFGFPLYSYLVLLFIFSFIVGFFSAGSIQTNGISSVVTGSIRAGRDAAAERRRQERSSRVGFHYDGD